MIFDQPELNCNSSIISHFGDSKYYSPLEYANILKDENSLKIIYMNVRSLIKNKNKIESLLLNMPIPPDIIAITETKLNSSIARRRRRLKGIHSRPDTNRTGAEGLSFYYPRLLHCQDQMLAVMSLSQHRVSSSKTVRPRAQCGARCIGHTVSTWSAVCSEAPYSQFGEEARPHLCMDEWNRPTPVRRRLSLTQAVRGKPIPTGLALMILYCSFS